jgi:hypothetical protein
MYLQVKAKSGLHAGAVWRLQKSAVSFGSSPTADIFLCDLDMPDQLLRLQRYGRRYIVEGMDNLARLSSAEQQPLDKTIFPGQAVTLDFRHIQLELQLLASGDGLFTSLGEGSSRFYYSVLRTLRGIGAKAIVAFLFVIGLLLTSMILFFGTAGVAKTQASVLSKKKETPHLQEKNANKIADQMALNVRSEFAELSRRLGSQGIDVNITKNQVFVDAVLSRVQAIEFERQLKRVTADYGDVLDIRARLDFSQEQKQVDAIDIAQIMLGNNPVIVLRDGTRLYVGSQFDGVNLVSIGSDKVVFQGDARYEVIL